jgi:hypothetical protein
VNGACPEDRKVEGSASWFLSYLLLLLVTGACPEDCKVEGCFLGFRLLAGRFFFTDYNHVFYLPPAADPSFVRTCFLLGQKACSDRREESQKGQVPSFDGINYFKLANVQ